MGDNWIMALPAERAVQGDHVPTGGQGERQSSGLPPTLAGPQRRSARLNRSARRELIRRLATQCGWPHLRLCESFNLSPSQLRRVLEPRPRQRRAPRPQKLAPEAFDIKSSRCQLCGGTVLIRRGCRQRERHDDCRKLLAHLAAAERLAEALSFTDPALAARFEARLMAFANSIPRLRDRAGRYVRRREAK